VRIGGCIRFGVNALAGFHGRARGSKVDRASAHAFLRRVELKAFSTTDATTFIMKPSIQRVVRIAVDKLERCP